MAKKMLMRILKKWGEYKVGDETFFDQSKAVSLMAHGVLEKAKPPKKPQRVSPIVETAVAPMVNVEMSDVKDKSEDGDSNESKSQSRFGKRKRG